MTSAHWARLVLVVIVGVVFQVALIDQISVFGAHPDVMILIAASAGIVAGPERGALIGFVAGLVADLVVVTPFGLAALCYVMVGFGVGLIRPLSSEQSLGASDALACIVAGAAGTLVFALLGALIGQPGMLPAAPAAIFVVTLGSCVLSYPTLKAVHWAMSGSAGSRVNVAMPRGGSAAG